ncbi:hypothetical protein [Mucilaginibacter celer]|uniref:Uncharacterized protein n=1 Tax=Mucilaginibacter celer TaxID=2305508 RepID=A0A494VX16_9SPHI|nr:hypothetical protein [Mucilaginibacter celer]AYL98939.1 hypothetical protein HYN43_028320 [Mucilaginibacter celer]
MRRRRNQISYNPFKWINNNQSTAQTYTNIIATFVTLIALIITVHYSNKGIEESEKSNNSAKEQLILAQQQYELSKQEIERSKKNELERDKKQAADEKQEQTHKYFDSIRIHRNDSFQIVSFAQQALINKQQLKAISKQAETAEAQFNLQERQSADIYERNKAIFTIDSVIINRSRATTPLVSFRIRNTGNLWAHADSIRISVFNPSFLYFNTQLNNTNADLSPNMLEIKTGGLPVYKDYIDLNDTFYCIIIYHYDTANKIEKGIPAFFRYSFDSKNRFTLLPAPAEMINSFSIEMNKRGIKR